MDLEKTRELTNEIDSHLRKNRDSIPDEAARLLEEARDELQQVCSDPPDDEEDLEASLERVALQLLRFFAKPEMLEQVEQIIGDLV